MKSLLEVVILCLFFHLQPEKMAEGLLLFIQGLGLGKTLIAFIACARSSISRLNWNLENVITNMDGGKLVILELGEKMRMSQCQVWDLNPGCTGGRLVSSLTSVPSFLNCNSAWECQLQHKPGTSSCTYSQGLWPFVWTIHFYEKKKKFHSQGLSSLKLCMCLMFSGWGTSLCSWSVGRSVSQSIKSQIELSLWLFTRPLCVCRVLCVSGLFPVISTCN